MDPITILLMNGFFLSFILFILLVILATRNGRPRPKLKGKSRIKEDIRKIKDQINGE